MLVETLPQILRESCIPPLVFFTLDHIDINHDDLSLTGLTAFGRVKSLVRLGGQVKNFRGEKF